MTNFSFKFDLGDRVYWIAQDRKTSVITCEVCHGKGRIDLDNGKEYSCPECYGRGGKAHHEKLAYRVKGIVTIGQQSVTLREGFVEIRYMCEEYGVGSGTLFQDDKLFDTLGEAEGRCNVLNEQQEQNSIKKETES